MGKDKNLSKYYQDDFPMSYKIGADFLDSFSENLDIDLSPEYEYEEITDYEGRRATHRRFKIGGKIRFNHKNHD